MQQPFIQYDYTNMLASRTGKLGARPLERRRMLKRLRIARQDLLERSRKKEVGFLSLGSESAKIISRCRSVLRRIPQDCDTLVVIGIGGSDLGAKAILQAVSGTRIRKTAMRVEFAGSTTEPAEVTRIISTLDPAKTCINIVSKSGGTIEPVSVFFVFHEWLIHSIGLEAAKNRIVVTTDPKKSPLLTLARKEGYQTLEIPTNVGGRYSVLTACGIFPALAAGCDVAGIFRGANHVARSFKNEEWHAHPSIQYALFHVLAYEKKQLPIHVCMPYMKRLTEFTRWVRQLVAESLGKNTRTGITQVAACGPEDQHSQLQLYADGPKDKVVSFIEERIIKNDIRVPRVSTLASPLSDYFGVKLGDILHAERKATAEALRSLGRPNETIFVDKLNEESLGALFMIFEIATVLMGHVMHVDPFNQPGVELSKHLAKLEIAPH